MKKKVLLAFIPVFLFVVAFITIFAEKKGAKEKTDFLPVRVIMEVDNSATKVILWSPEPKGNSLLLIIKITPETEIWMRGEKITPSQLGLLNEKEVEIWGHIEVLYEEGKEKQYTWMVMHINPMFPEKKRDWKHGTLVHTREGIPMKESPLYFFTELVSLGGGCFDLFYKSSI